MKKLKEIVFNGSRKGGTLVGAYPITTAAVAAFAILLAFYNECDFSSASDRMAIIMTTAFAFCFFACLIETAVPKGRKGLRYAACALALLPAFVCGFILAFDLDALTLEADKLLTKRFPVSTAFPMGGYVFLFLAALALVILRICHKRSGLPFGAYLADVFGAFLSAAAVEAAVLAGIGMLYACVRLLRFETDWSWIFFCAAAVVGGMGFLYALCAPAGAAGSFVKKLICFICLPVVCLGTLILYIYTGKVLLTGQVPSNFIFPVVTALFVGVLSISCMAQSCGEGEKYMCLLRALPWIVSPLMLFQIYAVAVRVTAYGFTPVRCFGIAILLAEIAFLLLTALKKDRGSILTVMAVLTSILLFCPGLNAEAVSRQSQERILKSALSDPEGETQRGSSAYAYLKGIRDMHGKSPADRYDGALFEEEENKRYGGFYRERGTLEIEGYSLLRNVSLSGEIDSVRLEDSDTGEYICTVDLTAMAEMVINDKETDGVLITPEGNKLILKGFWVRQDPGTNRFTLDTYASHGILLSKD